MSEPPRAVAIGVVAAGLVVADGAVAKTPLDKGGSATSEPGAASAVGPGISIRDARRSPRRAPVLVNGYLLVRARRPVLLCDSLNAARPPQCRGPRLRVRGFSIDERRRLATEQVDSAARWSPGPVQLLGVVRRGNLVIATNARA